MYRCSLIPIGAIQIQAVVHGRIVALGRVRDSLSSIRAVNPEAAWAFASNWERAWNAHDLNAILAHFVDDIVFSSPVAERIVPGWCGVIRGKGALRAYWAEGLRLIPDLRFVVLDVFVGVDVRVLSYRNQLVSGEFRRQPFQGADRGRRKVRLGSDPLNV